MIACAVIGVAGIATVELPFLADPLGFTGVGPGVAVTVVGVLVGYLVAIEAAKAVFYRTARLRLAST
jgi:hypothetical protein